MNYFFLTLKIISLAKLIAHDVGLSVHRGTPFWIGEKKEK